MQRILRAALVGAVTVASLTLAACSSDTAGTGDRTGTAGGSMAGGSAAAAETRTVDAAQAKTLVDDGAILVDVRTPEEFAAGHLVGATNIDVSAADFHQRVGELDPEATYVLYCRTGSRAGAAAQMMADMGFGDVVNAGGFDTLAASGLPSE